MNMDCIVVTPEFVAESVNGHEQLILNTIYEIKKKYVGLGLSNPKIVARLAKLGWVEVYDDATKYVTALKPVKKEATQWIAFLTPSGRRVTTTLRAIWRRKKK